MQKFAVRHVVVAACQKSVAYFQRRRVRLQPQLLFGLLIEQFAYAYIKCVTPPRFYALNLMQLWQTANNNNNNQQQKKGKK